MKDQYQALVVETQSDDEQKKTTLMQTERSVSDLPDDEILIEVHYSSLNYKDALVMSGAPGLCRQYPRVPGIDAVGTVRRGDDKDFSAGDQVLVTGFHFGVNHDGGYQQICSAPAEWVTHLPEGLAPKEAMRVGTAGLAAGLSVQELLDSGCSPSDGPVLVTGATGGVGSCALVILAGLGFEVTALSRKSDAPQMLERLGAKDVISPEDLGLESTKPMEKGRWAAVVDQVGGPILEAAIRQTQYGGVVTNCGMVAGDSISTSIFPFLLRGVRLIGVDTAFAPMAKRARVWRKFAGSWNMSSLESISREIGLDDVTEYRDRILGGGLTGRTIVALR